jgi:uncharacterized protein (UPF0248 family)
MKHARDVLNEIKWRSSLDLAETVVYYQDRVKPELGFIEGSRIISWDKSFIYTDTGSAIPFHRVEKIIYKDKELYMKPKNR